MLVVPSNARKQSGYKRTEGQEGTRLRFARMGEKIPKVGTLVNVGCQEPDFDTATMPVHFAARKYPIAAHRDYTRTVLLFYTDLSFGRFSSCQSSCQKRKN